MKSVSSHQAAAFEPGRAGFSLVEILVALLVVVILVALIILVLRQTRLVALRTGVASSLRTHAQIFAMYNADCSDAYPRFLTVGDSSGSVSGGGFTIAGLAYFDAHRVWHIALADQYYGGDFDNQSFFAPSPYTINRPIFTDYYYPCAFVADPKFWNAYTRTGPRQFRRCFAHEVVFPAAKSMLVWNQPQSSKDGTLNARHIVSAQVDTSAREIGRSAAAQGYDRGDGYIFQSSGAVHTSDLPPLLHTLGGVHGRDLQ